MTEDNFIKEIESYYGKYSNPTQLRNLHWYLKKRINPYLFSTVFWYLMYFYGSQTHPPLISDIEMAIKKGIEQGKGKNPYREFMTDYKKIEKQPIDKLGEVGGLLHKLTTKCKIGNFKEEQKE